MQEILLRRTLQVQPTCVTSKRVHPKRMKRHEALITSCIITFSRRLIHSLDGACPRQLHHQRRCPSIRCPWISIRYQIATSRHRPTNHRDRCATNRLRTSAGPLQNESQLLRPAVPENHYKKYYETSHGNFLAK